MTTPAQIQLMLVSEQAAPNLLPALDPAFERHAAPLRELYARYLKATTADAQLQLQQEAFQAQMAFTAATAALGSGLPVEANEAYNTFVQTRGSLMGGARDVLPGAEVDFEVTDSVATNIYVTSTQRVASRSSVGAKAGGAGCAPGVRLHPVGTAAVDVEGEILVVDGLVGAVVADRGDRRADFGRCRGHRHVVGQVDGLHVALPQAAAAIFCRIFWTFSSSVALVKGLTM